MSNHKIPIVVGVTGHRDLPEELLPALKEAVRKQLHRIQSMAVHSPVLVLSCLAKGADQICAQAAVEEGLSFAAALPMPLAEYEKDFSGKDLEMFRTLLESAAEVLVCPQVEPPADRKCQWNTPENETDPKGSRDGFYRQADIYVASHSHVLLALWDGREGKPEGCGTAETIDMMLTSVYRDRPEYNLHPADGAVIRIFAGKDRTGETESLGAWDLCQAVIKETDDFNRDVRDHLQTVAGSGQITVAGAGAESGSEKTATGAGAEPETKISASQEDARPRSALQDRLQKVYNAADEMSIRNAVKFNHILALLSVAATLLTIAFLVYDEVNLYWTILICAAMLVCLFLIRKAASRLRCHEKYLEYRILAEGLRVQQYLDHAGCGFEAASILPWPLQMHLPWIRKALAALCVGNLPHVKQSVRELWIKDQLTYHKNALVRTQTRDKINGTIVRTALVITIILYVAALLFEIFCGGLSGGAAVFVPQTTELLRTILKILMGGMSAVTVFVGNYYGKQSLEETADDHRRMIRLYSQADQMIAQYGETDAFLLKLAKEELSENSSWFAYQRMNRPEISL